MFPVEIFARTIAKFVDLVATVDLRYHLTGGAVSSAYGEPRLTQDIDIVIEPISAKKNVDTLIRNLQSSDFMFTEAVVRSAIKEGGMFQLLDQTESLKLDIYARELIPGELDRTQLLEVFEGVLLPVVNRIDAAISKLIWIEKGSHRSRRDFRGLFRHGTTQQQELIREQAMKFELLKLLEEVITESDEIE